MEEEKKLNEAVEIDEDFADSALPPVEEPAPEEPKEETKPEEPEATVVEEPEVPEDTSEYDSEYDDPRLEAIEGARKIWNHSYRKMSRIKFIVSTVTLIGILSGWLVPTFLMKDQGLTPLYIGLGAAVLGIAILLIFGVFQRRHDKAALRDYFNVYFGSMNEYSFDGLGITSIEGDVDSKVTKEEFLEGGAFDEAASVGSRDNVVFSYQGMDCALAEAAAQIDAGKQLQTIFVGKYLRTANHCDVSDDGLVIYFSGNDRALPPKKLESLHVCESSSRYKVYGASSDKKVLTKKFRDALAKIRTNKLLVDVTLVIKPGRTYWYLGYEDDIMVLPNDKPFDPKFVKEYRKQIADVLNAALILNETARA